MGEFVARMGEFVARMGEFVARMGDVLDLYQQAYHPERPVVCFDETSRQTRPPGN